MIITVYECDSLFINTFSIFVLTVPRGTVFSGCNKQDQSDKSRGTATSKNKLFQVFLISLLFSGYILFNKDGVLFILHSIFTNDCDNRHQSCRSL